MASKERLTEDLLARLLAAPNVESYLGEPDSTLNRDLPHYLRELLDEKGMKRAEVVRASGLNGTVVYDIMLALGMRCTLRETQRLLRLSGVSELWPKVRRDAIIIWCIDHGFDRSATDDELWSLGEQTLFHTGPLRAGQAGSHPVRQSPSPAQ